MWSILRHGKPSVSQLRQEAPAAVLTMVVVLGALSKSMATLVTQPLIVAKVRLQSRPPPERKGKPFKSFNEVLSYTLQHEGFLSLYKGIGPQLLKGVMVQGLLMMTKERYVASLI